MTVGRPRVGRRAALLVLAAGQLATSSCDRPDAPTAPTTAPEAGQSIANLAVTGSARTVGGSIVVTAAITPAADPARVGGYSLRLAYDTSRLAFVEEETAARGMAAVHGEGDVIRAAGASLSGFPDGLLLRATFRVRRAGAPGGLMLVIDELNGVDLTDRRPASADRRSARLEP